MRAPATKELQVKLWAQGGIWDSAAFLLSAAVYPGWSAAAGADVPERHGAVLHGSTAAGSQRNPALVLEEQQIGQAEPGFSSPPPPSNARGTTLPHPKQEDEKKSACVMKKKASCVISVLLSSFCSLAESRTSLEKRGAAGWGQGEGKG